jgi:hypothetical protein
MAAAWRHNPHVDRENRKVKGARALRRVSMLSPSGRSSPVVSLALAASGAYCEMSVESLAQFRLEQLTRRGMRESVDEHDIVRHLPLRQFF